jgi:hydrogenase maturation protease
MIICCGHAWRGDDAAGIEVGLGLRAMGLDVTLLERDAFALLDAWVGHDDVILVDAVVSGLAPGTVSVWEIDGEEQFEPARMLSIHSAGVAEAIALASVLGRLPRRLVLYGIEPASTEPLAGISDAVRKAIEKLKQELAAAALSR